MSQWNITANSEFIDKELDWFRLILDTRMKLHAGEALGGQPLELHSPPELNAVDAAYAEVIRELDMSAAERLVLILSYLPHIRPDALDPFFIQNRSLDRRFTEFGGQTGLAHGGFLPTAETAMFLLAGEDTHLRLQYRPLFSHEHYLYTQNVLRLDHHHHDEPILSSALKLTPEYIERLTSGRGYLPTYSSRFPAKRIISMFDWEDLILDQATRDEIESIITWAKNSHYMMHEWQLRKRLKPGYLALFYGPPGTGKTMTAGLLSKSTGMPVYRIDTSQVVDKYVGETEKNLASLFDHAQHQDWILFFDEAEALFGKRGESRNANDRAANQQISYLLQRIEEFPGIVILATNLQSYLDEAFTRRFQSMIHFPVPDAEQRLRLWEDNFKDKAYTLAEDVDLAAMAREYTLAGGSIINVLRYACLQAICRKPQQIIARDLLQGIRRELHKEGRFFADSK